MSELPQKPNDELTKFPDEDKIEEVQETLFRAAWEEPPSLVVQLGRTLDGLNEILSIWSKTLASDKLARILNFYYIDEAQATSDGLKQTQLLRQIDLTTCFFHHYIYAFDEFLNRKFRNSVIRCGLVCERIVKRLALGSGIVDALAIPKFEDQVNKLRAELNGKSDFVDDLSNFLQYVYRQRSARGAHDTKAATALTAKSCMTTTATIYMLYLNVLDEVAHKIEPKDDLVDLVNSTISTGTSIVVSQEGHRVKPSKIVESLYRRQFFQMPRTVVQIQEELGRLGYAFPRQTISDSLYRLSEREGILSKKGKTYVQRQPTAEYFKKEIID
jgi:hypothetical protein